MTKKSPKQKSTSAKKPNLRVIQKVLTFWTTIIFACLLY